MTNTAHTPLVGIVVQGIPADIKDALADEADRLDTSLRGVGGDWLAEHFGVAWRSRPRRSGGVGDGDQMEFKVPATVRRRIKVEAARRGVSMQQVILDVFAERITALR